MSRHWQANLKANPIFATSQGVRSFDDLLPDPSIEAYEAEIAQAAQFLDELEAIDVEQLDTANKLNHQLLSLDVRNQIEASRYGGKFLIMNNRSGPHLGLTSMVDRLPFFNLADYESYVTRLGKASEYLAKATALIRTGVEVGWLQACEPMQGYERSIETHIVEQISDSTFLKPFANRPKIVSAAAFEKLENTARNIIESQILPSLSQFLAFYLDEYQPACRQEVGIDAVPEGNAYYDYLVRYYTTTNLTPTDIHSLGLKEVARIREEMKEVMREAEFSGDFAAWLDYLANNPDFYPKTPEERMQAVAVIMKKMDGELPRLFGRLPRAPYGLKEIPKDIAEKTTTAYYFPPAGDGTRAGFYYVNTSLLETRPLYQLEALSLHEAVPGHHLQIALAQELDLPEFRKYGRQTVFIEGWGLYAERLGLEVGFYDTPYTNFGRLSYEMWRACRLVVDTGLHSKGWSRQQAIDYMAENSGLSMNNIVSEVDRYISWPGQALAYKIGELNIRELRQIGEQRLGEDFDVRKFHDQILENGSLPLSVLEQLFFDWLEEQA
ncbi:MAG: DUF885 domain-containing protein [Pseudomonadota bacterium]